MIHKIRCRVTAIFCLGSLIAANAFVTSSAYSFQRTPAPKGASAEILYPKNGATVGKTFTVKFGLSKMGVAPAGMDKKNTGHHHLLINVDKLPDLDKPIPADAKHRHFGGGQTEVELTLTPGKHTLQLLLGDYLHVPHVPPVMSEKITITVK